MKNDIKKIVVTYEDGTEEVIKKGAVIKSEQNENKEEILEFQFIDMSNEDVRNVVFGLIEMGYEIGYFKDNSSNTIE